MIFKNRYFLYEIRYNGEISRFTNANADVTFQGNKFNAEFISHSNIISSIDNSKNEINIGISIDYDIVDDFIGGFIKTPIMVRVIEIYNTQHEFLFNGEVTDLSISGKEVKLKAMFITNKINRIANRFKYQSVCNNQLFDSLCTVDEKLFKYDVVVKEVLNAKTKARVDNLTFDNISPDWFKNGKAVIKKNNSPMMIVDVDATNKIITFLNIFDIKIGDELTLYIGCNKTYQNCKERFDNTQNIIAEGSIPAANPFTSIF